MSGPMARMLGRLLAGVVVGTLLAGGASAAPAATAVRSTAGRSVVGRSRTGRSSTATSTTTSLHQDWATSTPVGAYHVRIVGETFSSPAVGDVTGDGDPEVVVGSNSGRVLVYSTGGTLLRSWYADPAPTAVESSPALADLDGNGKLDIVVALMPVDDAAAGSTVVAFRGDGTKLWGRKTCGTPRTGLCDAFATPAVGDLDGDGRPDVVVGTQDSYLYALRGSTGADLPGWPYFLYDTTWSSVAVADLDGDGRPEVVVASDLDVSTCRDNPAVQPCQFGSTLRVLRADGTERSRRNIPGEVTFSSPAVGDLTGDGRPDIVVGSGLYFLSQGYSDVPSRRVWAFDGSLNVLAGWPVQLGGRSMASPALADVDGDGRAEIATMAEDGRVTLLGGDGAVRWSRCDRDGAKPCDHVDFGMNSSPVIADVDGDGRLEVVADSESTVRVFDAATGAVEAEQLLWQPSRPIFANAATPAIAEVGGRARIYLHGLVDADGNGARSDGDADSLWSFSTQADLGAAPWPAFRQGPERLGTALRPVPLDQTPSGRYVIHAYQDLLGRPPTSSELVSSCNVLAVFGRRAMAQQLVFSTEWAGHVVRDLYTTVIGREPDPGGLAYWTGQVRGGRPARDVAISMYGSPEYLRSHGGTAAGFVDAIYPAILGRAPDGGGRAYWIGEVDRRGTAGVAADFYQSSESRARRVSTLYDQLMHRPVDPGGRDYWAGRLLTDDDLVLALNLVTSDEYVDSSQPPPQ